MASELRWFRMHGEFATDPVVQCLSFDDQRHFVMLLCFKCSGLLDKKFPTEQIRLDVIRKTLGLDGKAWDEARERLQAMNLIDENLQPRNWKKRQYIADTSTERVRKHRESKKKQGMKRSRNVPVTPPETETETETDSLPTVGNARKRADPPPKGLDQEAWNRWTDYRKQTRKPIKPVSVLAAQRKLAGYGEDQAEVVEQSIANGWQGLFPLKDAKPQAQQLTKFERLFGREETE